MRKYYQSIADRNFEVLPEFDTKFCLILQSTVKYCQLVIYPLAVLVLIQNKICSIELISLIKELLSILRNLKSFLLKLYVALIAAISINFYVTWFT